MDYHGLLMQRFPVRKSPEQKSAFRAWVTEEITGLGYHVHDEVNGHLKHHNLVVGNPDHAALLFTAHYDTPARMLLPDLQIPRNLPVFFAYQLLNLLLLLIPAFAVMLLVQGFFGKVWLSELALVIVYLAELMCITRGPANPNNANDNTSGVAALLSLMAAIPAEERGKVAFILFDNKEQGRMGSKAWGKEHQQAMYTRLTINLDCVGVGDHMLLAATDLARKCTGYRTLERMLAETEGCTAHFFGSRGTLIGSDQKTFKCGVGLTACRLSPGIGFITPAIHTPRDKAITAANIDYLTRALSAFVHALLGKTQQEEAVPQKK